MRNRVSIGGAFTMACWLVGTVPARAQCSEWKTGFHSSGTDQYVTCYTVHDDGSGPTLYMGGNFTSAGDVSANFVAKWDGTSWSALGVGTNATVSALTTFDDGTGSALYAGGLFTTAGGVAAHSIAKWDGTSWSALGTGTDVDVATLTVFDDGSGPALYAGGSFTIAGGLSANHITKWNGTSWSSLGTGTNAAVSSLAVFDDGFGPALYAAGSFTTAGGMSANRIAKWNGSTWSPLGGGLDNTVAALFVHDDGSGSALYVGGRFGTAGGAAASRIARWDGATWSPLGGGVGSSVWALTAFDDGTGSALYAGGPFTSAGGASANGIAKWNGTSWSTLGTGTNNYVSGLTAFDDGSGPALYAGGLFTIAGDEAASRVARWKGARWERVGDGSGLSARVDVLTVFDDGSGPALYAGGAFLTAGTVIANRIASWDGRHWSALGSGLGDALPFGHSENPIVFALTVFDAGSGSALYAGGYFTTAGGANANFIAQWDGASWSALGSGLNSSVYTLCVFDDGAGSALYAGGDFTTAGSANADKIAKWNGTSWSPLAGTGSVHPEIVFALAVFDDGSGPALSATGSFSTAAGPSTASIAAWDGTRWSVVGSGIYGEVYALSVFDDGAGSALYAGGQFTLGPSTASIAKWDGTSWSNVGSGIGSEYVYRMTVFDDGTGPALFVGGDFTSAGGVSANRIAKWNGTSWSALGAGVDGGPWIDAMAVFDDGVDGAPDLYVGGQFTRAGGTSSVYVAQWLGCEPGDAYCFGDGLDTAVTANCPCGNLGAAGHGCGNSNPELEGARLDASGSVNPNTIVLACSGVPNGNLCVFQSSANSTGAGITFGDGIRCVIGAALPFGQQVAGSRANPSHTVQSSASTEPSGTTRYYQVLYRNPSPAACAPALFNLSNAYSIAW